MGAEPSRSRREFPIVRRGYDAHRVDAFLGVLTAELDRLAADNRMLHRKLADATAERDGITAPVRAELEAARAELDRLVREARAERDRAGADVEAARAELDRLAQLDRDRAFVDVQAARAEAEALVDAAHAERDRARADVEAARAELDRLVRARIEVHRELSALGEALRRWMSSSATTDDGQFLPPPSRALPSSRKTGPAAGPKRR